MTQFSRGEPDGSPTVDPMVAAITHELRTPLQAIIGFTQLARMDWPAEVDPRYLTQIERASRMMLRSVNDLLDLGQLERGTLVIEPDQDLDLVDVFRQLEATAGSLLQGKDLSVQMRLDGACPRHLRGDAKRIQQVLLNLLANAIRFTDRGRVTVQARVLAHRGDTVQLRLAVGDTGIGVPAADLDALLDPVPASEGPAAGARRSGTGFGLRIVRQLLALMGSHLHGASVSGGGTLMWFDLLLPCVAVAQPTASAAAPQPASGWPEGVLFDPVLQGMQVLVVEDNNLNLLVLSDFLARLGVQAEVAGTGQRARERLTRGGARWRGVRHAPAGRHRPVRGALAARAGGPVGAPAGAVPVGPCERDGAPCSRRAGRRRLSAQTLRSAGAGAPPGAHAARARRPPARNAAHGGRPDGADRGEPDGALPG